MAKTNLKKDSRLVCVPCGREVVVDCCGASSTLRGDEYEENTR